MSELTPRQSELLEYLRREWRGRRRPPSVREIAVELGISVGTAHSDLRQLELAGAIRREHGKSRAVAAIEAAAGTPNMVTIPVADNIPPTRVTAGSTRPTMHIGVSSNLASEGAVIVRLRSFSSTEPGILEGDFALVEPSGTLLAGVVVLAKWGHRIAIGRLMERDGRWDLTGHPSKRRSLNAPDLVGVVKAILRFYR